MSTDPNQPQQSESNQQSPPPHPYGEPQPSYYQPQWGQQLFNQKHFIEQQHNESYRIG